MYWDRMSMAEFAQSQRAQGLKIQLLDGIWWVEIRPFFFRPLFPFTRILPHAKPYPRASCVGGYLHVVPDGAAANSCMNFFVFDQLKQYSLQALNSRQRTAVRSSMKYFQARTIVDPDEFIESAYDVYLCFQRRTNYSYKDERVNRDEFIQWTKNLYRFPKIHKLGVFHEGKLCAVEASYRVENVIVGDTLFANDAALKLKVTDFIYHTIRQAAAHTDAEYYFIGLPTGVPSLDQSKLYRGCKVLSLPAHYRINPLAFHLVKVLMRSSYHKLMQIMRPPAPGPVFEPVTLAGEPAEGGVIDQSAVGNTLGDHGASTTLEPEQVAVENFRQAQEAATTDTRSIPPT